MLIQIQQVGLKKQILMRVENIKDQKNFVQSKGCRENEQNFWNLIQPKDFLQNSNNDFSKEVFIFSLEFVIREHTSKTKIAKLWTINFLAQCLINTDRTGLLLRFTRQENFDS